MAEPFKLLVLPGDGISPEVVAAALEAFKQLCRRDNIDTRIEHDLLHGAAWEACGSFCRDQTLTAAQDSHALLVGAVGGVKWGQIVADGTTPAERDGLMRLREELQTYACLRPARAYPALRRGRFRTRVAMMFEYSLARADLAGCIENAVEHCLQAGVLTADLGGNADTERVCETILSALA